MKDLGLKLTYVSSQHLHCQEKYDLTQFQNI